MHYFQGLVSSDYRVLTQAKELFARREEFQLHILLAHPPQLVQENGAGPRGNRAVLFDGEFQDEAEIAAIFSRCRLRGKPSHQRWLHGMYGLEVVASHPSRTRILRASKHDKVSIAGTLSRWRVEGKQACVLHDRYDMRRAALPRHSREISSTAVCLLSRKQALPSSLPACCDYRGGHSQTLLRYTPSLQGLGR